MNVSRRRTERRRGKPSPIDPDKEICYGDRMAPTGTYASTVEGSGGNINPFLPM